MSLWHAAHDSGWRSSGALPREVDDAGDPPSLLGHRLQELHHVARRGVRIGGPRRDEPRVGAPRHDSRVARRNEVRHRARRLEHADEVPLVQRRQRIDEPGHRRDAVLLDERHDAGLGHRLRQGRRRGARRRTIDHHRVGRRRDAVLGRDGGADLVAPHVQQHLVTGVVGIGVRRRHDDDGAGMGRRRGDRSGVNGVVRVRYVVDRSRQEIADADVGQAQFAQRRVVVGASRRRRSRNRRRRTVGERAPVGGPAGAYRPRGGAVRRRRQRHCHVVVAVRLHRHLIEVAAAVHPYRPRRHAAGHRQRRVAEYRERDADVLAERHPEREVVNAVVRRRHVHELGRQLRLVACRDRHRKQAGDDDD